MTKSFSRRSFLKASALSAAAVSSLSVARSAHAADGGKIKVGLIGCGGRGRGAAKNALDACEDAELVAVGDAFKENAAGAVEGLQAEFEDRVTVTDETTFAGLECYKDVIPLCDVVLLAQAPGFRPDSLRAAVEAGKHVFCEKPVAVDAPGIKSVLESTEIAKKNGKNLVSGLCWRYDYNVRDIMGRVLDGAIGDIVSSRLTYLAPRLWTRPSKPGDTEMMYQVRNWYNYAWLSGDFNVEQHVHTLDKALWAMGDKPPVAAFGLGARMQRVDQPAYGDIYDSMAVVYEYPNGVTHYSYCRQQDGCFTQNEAFIAGTKGVAVILDNTTITDYKGNVIYRQEKKPSDMYLIEHQELFGAIKKGEVINNGKYMAYSTMMGIMGREVCYSGKRMTWEEALELPAIRPTGYTPDSDPPTLPDANGRYLVHVPGEGLKYHQVIR